MDILFYPLESLREVNTLLLIASKCKIQFELEFIKNTFNKITNKNYSEATMFNSLQKFYYLMNHNDYSMEHLNNTINEEIKSKPSIIVPPYLNCRICKAELDVIKKTQCIVFTLIEEKKAVAISKFCKYCEITYNIDTFKLNNNDMCAYEMDTNFVSISSETVFEVVKMNIYEKLIIKTN